MLSPTEPTEADVKKFLIKRMKIDQEAAEALTFVSLSKVYLKKSKNPITYTMITLKSNHERT